MWRKAIEIVPRERLDALQWELLQALVDRLWHQVPFYRRMLQDSGFQPGALQSLSDAPLLPLTTKADLNREHPFGLLAVPPERIARYHASSGTKGKPTLIAYTAADLRHWADICARMLTAAGCRKGQNWYVTSGYGLFTGGLGAHYGLERIGASVIPASSGNTARVIRLMRDIQPTGIHCIPSYMLRIAEVADAAGLDPQDLGLKFGSFGGEVWSEEMRNRIEQRFGLKAYDVYGLSECFGPGVAYECEAQAGLHLNEDHFLAEIIDPKTEKPLPEGEQGELVLTTLTKEAMPLLRYRTGDLTRIVPGACPCGRTHRRIGRISGRSDDMVIIRGVNLYPSEVERILLSFAEVGPEHRLVIDRTGAMDTVTLEAELAPAPRREVGSRTDGAGSAGPDSASCASLADAISRQLKAELGLTIKLRLSPAGALPRREGKAIRMVDLRPGIKNQP